MRIGIDIGGSHIAIAVVDENKIIEKIEYVYDQNFKQAIKENIIELLKKNIAILLEKYSIEKIGISLAGHVKDNVLIHSPNLPELNETDFAEILNDIFSIPVAVNVDSLCAAKAERKYGCIKNYKKGIFLVIGTGIGGVTFDNDYIAVSEYGHMVIQKDGKLCRCGKSGCFETYGSMKAFKQIIEEKFGIANHSGEVIRAFLRENSNNSEVIETIDNYISDFCLGLINIIDINTPEVIGFGGSFSYYEDILLEKIEKQLQKSKLFIDKKFLPKLVVGDFKNDAGMIGATLF